jgi:hypothetical protein
VNKPFSWNRLAITAQDFKREDLIAFPVRQHASSQGWNRRCREYITIHGDRCIECDAIPPGEIRDRLQDAIESHVDPIALGNLQKTEQLERETINRIFSPGRLGKL